MCIAMPHGNVPGGEHHGHRTQGCSKEVGGDAGRQPGWSAHAWSSGYGRTRPLFTAGSHLQASQVEPGPPSLSVLSVTLVAKFKLMIVFWRTSLLPFLMRGQQLGPALHVCFRARQLGPTL